MPVYEYCCDECGCRFEEYRELKQRSACPCPECGKSARKVFRPVGIIFKGSGFHVTDYGKPEAKPRTEPSKPKPDVPEPKPAASAADKGSSND